MNKKFLLYNICLIIVLIISVCIVIFYPNKAYLTCDKSENILPIKERLYVMGYYLSNMEDVFDAELEAAVLDFQISKGLTPTGALDRITMVQIENEFARTEVMVDNQLYEAYESFGGNKEDLIKFLEGEE